ncbi:MAG: hypothetical protein ACPG77_03430, partial [Nannocystaceae bacterium]
MPDKEPANTVPTRGKAESESANAQESENTGVVSVSALESANAQESGKHRASFGCQRTVTTSLGARERPGVGETPGVVWMSA